VVISRPEYADGPARFVSSLIVDFRHPYFFDHPCDHVPGMLLLEGCAQAALAAFAEATSVPRWASAIGAYDVDFGQFVECGLQTTLTAHVNAAQSEDGGVLQSTVAVTISQAGVVAGTATMRIASPVRV
jgi:3-hydroxymyristoyl/3-hydroxydecanoyl-(acyl carrier protein) dehydratase